MELLIVMAEIMVAFICVCFGLHALGWRMWE